VIPPSRAKRKTGGEWPKNDFRASSWHGSCTAGRLGKRTKAIYQELDSQEFSQSTSQFFTDTKKNPAMAFDETFSGAGRQPIFSGGVKQFDAMLLKIVDGGLAGCIFLVPLLLGGRQALGQLVLVGLAVVVALAWAARQCLARQGIRRRSAGCLLLAAGAALLVLQIAPLPVSLLERISPHTAEILPLWSATGGEAGGPSLGQWSRVSLAPAETEISLVLFLAYGMLFWVTLQRIRTVQDVERILRWCAISAVLTATFGLVQFATSNGKFFWVYEHPYTHTDDAAKGGFTNRNHFAHFLALGMGPLIWWIQDSLRKRRSGRKDSFADVPGDNRPAELTTGLAAAALTLVLLGGLLSFSRGGAVVIFAAVLISAAICYRAGALGGRLASILVTVALLIGLTLSVTEVEGVDRLGELTSGSLETLDKGAGRRTIWAAALKAIPDYLAMGSGAGSFQDVYPMYIERQPDSIHYTHCESGLLQVPLETGIAGGALLVIGILMCAFWCAGGLLTAPNGRIFVCVGAVTASLAVSLLHSAVDFVWYVPACAAVVAILAAAACRLRQLSEGKDERAVYRVDLPRPAAALILISILVLGGWMLGTRLGPVAAEQHWVNYSMLERAAAGVMLEAGEIVEDDGPSVSEKPAPSRWQSPDEALLATERKMAAELEQVIRWDPNRATAQLKLSAAYLRLFDLAQQENGVNAMPLSQIREAAIASDFDSRQALEEWLARAIGGPQYRYLQLSLEHARRGLSLCPLHGEGYVYLGETSFLEGRRNPDNAAYVEQALKVRPVDGTVLFHVGQATLLAGDVEGGLEYWRRSYDCGRAYQRQVILWLAGRIVPEALDEDAALMIEVFEPDLYGLHYMYNRYRQLALPERLTPLLKALGEKAEEEARLAMKESRVEEAAEYWLEAMAVHVDMHDDAGGLACAEEAFGCNPHDFRARYKLGCLLADQGRLAEAEEHLDWCYQRRPDQIPLKNRLMEIRTIKFGGGRLTAGPGARPAPYRR
jgi:O-antigen ligase/tetratricopeptide (TPR) repeat protein